MASDTNHIAEFAESLDYPDTELTNSGVLKTKQGIKGESSCIITPTTSGHSYSPTTNWSPVLNLVKPAGHKGRSAGGDQCDPSNHEVQEDSPDAVTGCRYCRSGKAIMSTSSALLILEAMSLEQIANEVANERAQVVNHLDKISGLMSRLRALEKVLRQVVQANDPESWRRIRQQSIPTEFPEAGLQE